MADAYVDGNLAVIISDTGAPTGGRYVAEIQLRKEGNQHPVFQYYEYGVSYQEALDNAKQWIATYKAEIR